MSIHLDLQHFERYYRIDAYSSRFRRWQVRQCWQFKQDAYQAAWKIREQGKRVRIVQREAVDFKVVETVIYED